MRGEGAKGWVKVGSGLVMEEEGRGLAKGDLGVDCPELGEEGCRDNISLLVIRMLLRVGGMEKNAIEVKRGRLYSAKDVIS